ncbi:DUF3089 domain-containing protein [Altererythrobacter xixiisoli]|uniref:DUF3089 domain-containing protein n=1 Tax=Croceibacterium xixiisoli TaxID=1476466 RepID=A0A6I4TXY9_9SPHN|nr:DUF3089 domain-containing protein [Croceibacterium xixiisoli]MXO99637.1 DUF3089 domain-containing protein [Croceibacterium xixiisoli]
MARKFLYVFAILIVIVLGAGFALRIFSDKAIEIAFVPSAEFVEQDPLQANAYLDPDMWFSRPGFAPDKDPSRWQPAYAADPAAPAPTGTASASPTPAPVAIAPATASPTPATTAAAQPAPVPAGTDAAPAGPGYAVFFVHPTSFLERTQWNGPLTDAKSHDRARLFLRGMASAFNRADEIWAPRYRQATFGAFLTDSPNAKLALDAAYHDVEQAFDVFLDSVDKDKPIVLAGHSQGAMHILRLLRERGSDPALRSRIAMVYPVGWPVSLQHDLPALGLPACATPQQGGCIATWTSFAEPAEPGLMMEIYGKSAGFDGQPRGSSPVLCVNPINGLMGGTAQAADNLGTLVPNAELTSGELIRGAVPARCDANGLLMIGDPPNLGAYVLPGNNYHVYDIPLFWANLQVDVPRRVAAWAQNRPPVPAGPTRAAAATR